MPERIQRSRAKGWRMPEDAVYVGRGSGEYGRWGNPYYAAQCIEPTLWIVASRLTGDGVGGTFPTRARAVKESVRRFRRWAVRTRLDVAPLRGRDLACWCPLDRSCHADVLLELANPKEPRDPAGPVSSTVSPSTPAAGSPQISSQGSVMPSDSRKRSCTSVLLALALHTPKENPRCLSSRPTTS